MTNTPHDPADVQTFIEAYDKWDETGLPSHQTEMYAAREALRPKPEMEKVLPDERPLWFKNLCEQYLHSQIKGPVEWTSDTLWQELVTLTMRPVQKQKWNMPEWAEVRKDGSNYMNCPTQSHPDYAITPWQYGAIAKEILSLNEKLPSTTGPA